MKKADPPYFGTSWSEKMTLSTFCLLLSSNTSSHNSGVMWRRNQKRKSRKSITQSLKSQLWKVSILNRLDDKIRASGGQRQRSSEYIFFVCIISYCYSLFVVVSYFNSFGPEGLIRS